MMLTVHGLPIKTKFQDVKDLIKQECNIPDFILDNLVDDGFNAKKVRIGLTNENDGYRLMKCLEGFRMSGSHVLKIIPVGKPPSQPQSSFEPRSSYSHQSRNDYSNQSQDYSSQHDYHRQSNTVNPSSHVSPHSSRNAVPETRQHGTDTRGLSDARQSLSHAMADTRGHQDRYQGQAAADSRSTDFRDPSRGPLAPPASMDAYESRGPRPGALDSAAPLSMRGQDSTLSYRASTDHRQVPNPEPMNCQQQWSGGSDQWPAPRAVPNQNTGYSYQQPQGNTGYVQQSNIATMQAGYAQSRAPQMQPYQQTQQPKIPAQTSRTHVLRSVQLVDAPITPRATPAFPSTQKPVTIMKDNFQGPSQYNVTGQPTQTQGTYQGQGTQQTWAQQGQTKQLAYDKSYDERRLAQDKQRPDAKAQPTQDYDKRRFSPTRGTRPASPGRSPPRKISSSVSRSAPSYPERRVSPTRPFTERRASPSRHIASTATDFAPSGRRVSPSKISPAGRRPSPTRKTSPRRISPVGRRASPRRTSPSGIRRISPFARKVSPRRASPSRKPSPGRRVSPSGKLSPRRASPPSTGRRVSPFGRKISPGRRTSPGRRVSAGRSVSPPGKRGSPRRNDPRRMSPSMTNYDYYVEDERRMGGRLESPRRYSPKRSPPRGPGRYSPNEKYDSEMSGSKSAKPIRPAYEPTQAQKYTGAGFRPIETPYAATARNEPKIPTWQNEKTAYPVKKDDRDVSRMGRMDIVEKKPSPRSRSRSPVKDRYRRHSPSPRSPRRSWALEKRRSPEAIREPPPPPLWPGQDAEDKPKHPVWDRNDSDEERRFDDKRGRKDEKYAPRFSPRRDDRREYRDEPKFERNYHPEDRGDYRRDSPHRDEKKLFNEVDKDFNDIYQRAVEFRRKTEELRKSNDRRNRSYDEEDVTPTRETPPSRKNADRQDKQKPNWIPIKIQTKIERNKTRLDAAGKEKRDKAVDEIANRILEPHNFTGDQRHRVMEELKLSIFNIMLEMFKDKDVSYIELVIKFRARYDAKDEEKILQDVLTSMPSHYRNMLKRKGEGATEVAPKVSRRSPAYTKEDNKYPSRGHISNKLTSRHESRKHGGVIDGRITKKSGGLGHPSRRKSPSRKSIERNVKEPRLLSPKYIYEDKPRLIASAVVPKPEVQRTAPRVEPPAHQAHPESYNELSPLMTSMVEDELKNIMINIWQTLPDTVPTEVDKLILDKFKDTAGDDLRNTIGLNVTKRLLNVHNGILVKILIFSEVTPSEIYSFTKKYDIAEFKHVQKWTFAGRLTSWTNLDELTTNKNLKCGKARVTVTPIYNFLKCPSNLRTVFDGNQNYSKAKQIEMETAKKMKEAEAKAAATNKVLVKEVKKEIVKKTDSLDKIPANKSSNEQVPDNKRSREKGLDTSHSKDTFPSTKKVDVLESRNTGPQKKIKTEVAKNVPPAKHTVEKPVTKQYEPTITIKKEMTTSKSGNVKTETKLTKMDTAKVVDKKPINANVKKEIKTETPAAKVETTKTVAHKPPATTSPRVATSTPKAGNNNPKVATNTSKAATTVPTTPKKDIVAAKPNEKKSDVKITKAEPPKAPVKETTKTVVKPVANKPTIPNSAKGVIAPKPSVVKKPEIKAAKVSPPKVEQQTKKLVNKPVTNLKKVVKKPNNKFSKVFEKSVRAPTKNSENIKEENDFDELCDRDILALLSSGIVLDECSGSDLD